MALTLDTDTFDSEEVVSGGSGATAAAGWHHLRLEESEEKENRFILSFEVVSPGSECGKFCRDSLWFPKEEDTSKWPMKRIYIYAFALGVITVDEYNAARAAGQQCEIDFNAVLGAQCVGNWHQDRDKTWTDKSGNVRPQMTLGGDIYSLTHKNAAKAVIDWDTAATIGITQEMCEKAWGAKATAAGSGYTTKAQGATATSGKATAAAKSTYADI